MAARMHACTPARRVRQVPHVAGQTGPCYAPEIHTSTGVAANLRFTQLQVLPVARPAAQSTARFSAAAILERSARSSLVEPRAEQYTWWSSRGQVWANNVGWRIDYQIATPGFAGKTRSAAIYKDERFSDHAPLTIEYAL
jgi:exonuclease III